VHLVVFITKKFVTMHGHMNVKLGMHCMCELSEKGPLCVTGVRNDGHFLWWPLNIINTLFGNINK
jgi:hypothetical protein